MDSGCPYGGILKLRELIEEHPAELAYDLRNRCGVSINQIGDEVSLLEAVYLVSVLLRDPGTWLASAKADWDYPASREWIVGVHTYDLLSMVNSKKKPNPYPTPWPNEQRSRLRSRKQQSRQYVLERLAQMNPKENNGA